MLEIIERVDHKYQDQESGETFSLAWRHIKVVGQLLPPTEDIIKELFMPPDAKVTLYPQDPADGFNHYVVSGWWGRN